MIAFVDEHRDSYGVEPICRQLPMAPSVYYEAKACERDPERRSARRRRDERLKLEIRRVFDENFGVYGVRKVWIQLNREKIVVAKCTVRRLMRELGLRGASRGRAFTVTTRPGNETARPADLVDRQFRSEEPNRLWVSDITYVATWNGFVYTCFVIDCYAWRIVGWRTATTLRTELVLDAVEQAICERLGPAVSGVVLHSDAGSQYLSIRYGERLATAGIEPSVGSVGDSYDNALAETINGLYKTEVIRRQGPWRGVDDVELATLTWVDWWNNRRILEPIGDIPPAEKEASYYRQHTPAITAGLT